MKPNKPTKKHVLKSFVKKVKSNPGYQFKSRSLLGIKGGNIVTPAMYRNLHLGKKKAKKK